MVKIFSSLFTSAAVLATTTSAATVDPQLRHALKGSKSSATANIMITMNTGIRPATIIRDLNQRSYDSRVKKISSLHEDLVENARLSQERVLDALSGAEGQESLAVNVESLWISNEMYIPNATPELINRLASMPDIATIYQEHVIQVEAPILADDGSSHVQKGRTLDAENEWGIKKVGAPEVWASGNYGQGVLVGSIDTGVQGTHEALKDNFVGEYGWFDPYSNHPVPIDTNGHGTHTMGTIAGQNGIGVAPKSQWMTCRGCTLIQCTERALKACGQFILCPTDVKGNNADCSKAPQVVSNSWGDVGDRLWYKDIVDAWVASGIVPVFAQGNSGPSCSSAGSPGDYHNVIGVGATTVADTLAKFSSVGPARNGLTKPNIAAPGEDINSAWIGGHPWADGDSNYGGMSGTSMACPHVAGVVALMLADKEDLTYDQIFKAMTVSATTDVLSGPGRNCGDNDELTYPNNAFGYGLLHAPRAIESCDGSTYASTPAPIHPYECKFDVISGTCKKSEECEGRMCIPTFGALCLEGCE